MLKLTLQTADDMLALGQRFAQVPAKQCVIFLQGPLGAGKTTLVRGILRGLGYLGAVKSPTYTLVETYHLPSHTVFHWDMYRLSEPEELENIGIRDYAQQPAWWIVEWPEHVQAVLPPPDVCIEFSVKDTAREMNVIPLTECGRLFECEV